MSAGIVTAIGTIEPGEDRGDLPGRGSPALIPPASIALRASIACAGVA